MSKSARERERERLAWRAFLLPHWSRLKRDHVLEDDEETILGVRLGIVTDRPITQRQLAQRFRCSTTRISEIERSALRKVRAIFKFKAEETPDGTSTS